VTAPSDAELRQILLDALARVAPDADAASLGADADLRAELEIDSIDVLNWAIALHEATGVDVPERDYPELSTLARAVAYLRRRLGGG
jgi:acyl carrier protein